LPLKFPTVEPMPLARLNAPFDHPDWIFEPKLDGFRALAYVTGGTARLVSRNGNVFKSFPELSGAIGTSLRCEAVWMVRWYTSGRMAARSSTI
jgi:bifunctional non-homologous end joining protein LigD